MPVPEPILLNAWKHHLGFIKDTIQQIKTDSTLRTAFLEALKLIGASQMDLYTGMLGTDSISAEICAQLKQKDVFLPKLYETWLNSNGGYQEIEISDGSEWTLLWGNEVNRHIHIHPSRYSSHSMRVKANTLKTALVYIIYESDEEIDINQLNNVRNKYLALAPLKNLASAESIVEMIGLLKSMI